MNSCLRVASLVTQNNSVTQQTVVFVVVFSDGGYSVMMTSHLNLNIFCLRSSLKLFIL